MSNKHKCGQMSDFYSGIDLNEHMITTTTFQETPAFNHSNFSIAVRVTDDCSFFQL